MHLRKLIFLLRINTLLKQEEEQTDQTNKRCAKFICCKDNIDIGSDNIIPLWMFGFLY